MSDLPTPAQVASVESSLANIGDLLRDTHNFSLGTLTTLFQLEEQPEIADENVWEVAGGMLFLGVVGCIPYVGALVAGVCAATYVLAQQEAAPAPTDFTGTLAEVSNWLDQSFEGAITQVDKYAANVPDNWQTVIETPGYAALTLAELADNPAPAKGTTDYDTLWSAAMVSVKRALWSKTLDQLFMVVEYGGMFGPSASGPTPAQVLGKLTSQSGDLGSYFPVYGQGTAYKANKKQLAYKRKGDIKEIPSSASSWIFTDNALGGPRPAGDSDTAFCIHADVLGTYDPVTGAWQTGTGWITKHLPFG